MRYFDLFLLRIDWQQKDYRSPPLHIEKTTSFNFATRQSSRRHQTMQFNCFGMQNNFGFDRVKHCKETKKKKCSAEELMNTHFLCTLTAFQAPKSHMPYQAAYGDDGAE